MDSQAVKDLHRNLYLSKEKKMKRTKCMIALLIIVICIGATYAISAGIDMIENGSKTSMTTVEK